MPYVNFLTNFTHIAVTGDLIDSRNPDVDIAMAFINGALDIATVYYATGNHEAWSGKFEELEKKISEAGVVLLRDAMQEIERNGQSIYLMGLDDPDFAAPGEGHDAVAKLFSQKLDLLLEQTEGYYILLSHRPELFDTYTDFGVNLVLSGHAHGGQIRLPFIGGLAAPNQGFFPKFTDGCYENGDTKMVVSRGLGNSLFPVRINNRPEIVAITLLK